MSLLDVALACAARGWYVFPCKPKGKEPMIGGGFKSASNLPDDVRMWWNKWPDANVGIATGASGLTVLDIDHGLKGITNLRAFCAYRGIPETYTVRTGRRDGFGVQMYFQGGSLKSIPWVDSEDGTINGDVRSGSGYVMAAGSYHPSGAFYEALVEAPIASEPPYVRGLRTAAKTATDDGLITEHRNTTLTSIAGKLRNAGLSAAALEVSLLQVNADRCVPPLGEDEVKRIAANASAWTLPDEPEVLIGGKATQPETQEPVDWRTLFHTREEMDNAPPISFLIEGFLQCEGVTAIAAPVRERKSMIAINMVHALLTGEKLFGHFEVVKRPTRVLYLVPEVSLGPWTDRLRRIGLLDFVGKTLFCRTLSSPGHLSLNDESLLPALPGSVVFLDTAIRFLEGDENSSKDIRAFADGIFALLRHGAESVVMLHHSPKDTGDVMTLENAMRGSGDMGAFLASCWGTKLQDPTDPYKSASFITNLKQRDFESKDFEATCGEDCRMYIVGEPGEVRLQTRTGFKGNKDGKDDAAAALLRAHPKMSSRESAALLSENGIKRSKDWVQRRRAELLQENGGNLP
jgi:Bifunctional DNA primase/polymerase, N-terminal/AAA domain/Primase C terminal 1 (PriCT-1)